LTNSQRVAVEVDGRRSESELNRGYAGWQDGANATFEQKIGQSAIVSASLLAPRDAIEADFYSSKTLGANLGVGAELPGGSILASRAE